MSFCFLYSVFYTQIFNFNNTECSHLTSWFQLLVLYKSNPILVTKTFLYFLPQIWRFAFHKVFGFCFVLGHIVALIFLYSVLQGRYYTKFFLVWNFAGHTDSMKNPIRSLWLQILTCFWRRLSLLIISMRMWPPSTRLEMTTDSSRIA